MSRPVRILFVCTGNTCRSPMAEALARRRAAERGLAIEVRSAGVWAAFGSRASDGARRAAEREGLDLSDHRSTPLDGVVIDWADVLVAMTAAHLRAVSPHRGGPVAALATDWLPEDDPRHGAEVPDPFGGDDADYARTLDVLRDAVSALLDAVEEGRDRFAAAGRSDDAGADGGSVGADGEAGSAGEEEP